MLSYTWDIKTFATSNPFLWDCPKMLVPPKPFAKILYIPNVNETKGRLLLLYQVFAAGLLLTVFHNGCEYLMGKKFKRMIVLALFVIVFASIFIPFQTALVFYKENTDQLEAFLPIDKGKTFAITFTHSIHLTDVVEKYRISDEGQIEQYEIVYEEFGIGMPSNAEEGAEFVYEGGRYHIKNLHNMFPSINVRNGKTVSENRLSWGEEHEKEVRFNEYFTPGDWFTIKVETLSIWDYLKGVKING